ncbi:MAG: hypothetical protein WA738_06920 [Candidatus Angelobacter sp.]
MKWLLITVVSIVGLLLLIVLIGALLPLKHRVFSDDFTPSARRNSLEPDLRPANLAA